MNLKGDIIRVNKAKEKEIEQMRQEEKQKQAEELKQKDKGKFGIWYDLEVWGDQESVSGSSSTISW